MSNKIPLGVRLWASRSIAVHLPVSARPYTANSPAAVHLKTGSWETLSWFPSTQEEGLCSGPRHPAPPSVTTCAASPSSVVSEESPLGLPLFQKHLRKPSHHRLLDPPTLPPTSGLMGQRIALTNTVLTSFCVYWDSVSPFTGCLGRSENKDDKETI